MWTKEQVEETFSYRGVDAIRARGTRYTAPFIPQAEKNIEFDFALKKLGKLGERVFRLRYLDGYGLDKINEMLEAPYKDIESAYYSVKNKVMDYLVRR